MEVRILPGVQEVKMSEIFNKIQEIDDGDLDPQDTPVVYHICGPSSEERLKLAIFGEKCKCGKIINELARKLQKEQAHLSVQDCHNLAVAIWNKKIKERGLA